MHGERTKTIRYNFVCLTLRGAHKLRVSDNTVFRKIFDPKRNQVVREWRKLNSEKLRDFFLSKYCSGDKFKDYEMVGACGMYGGKRNGFRVLVGKLE